MGNGDNVTTSSEQMLFLISSGTDAHRMFFLYLHIKIKQLLKSPSWQSVTPEVTPTTNLSVLYAVVF